MNESHFGPCNSQEGDNTMPRHFFPSLELWMIQLRVFGHHHHLGVPLLAIGQWREATTKAQQPGLG